MKSTAVIGGGISGVAFALIAKRLGLQIQCEVYEAGSRESQTGGCVILAPNALRVLNVAGVLEKVSSVGYSLRTTEFYDKCGTHIVSRKIGDQEEFGEDTLLIRRSDLVRALYESADEAGVTVHFAKRLAKIKEEDDSMKLAFEDGSFVTVDFVVGADGIHSKVREFIVDSPVVPNYSGFVYLAGFCDAEETDPMLVEQSLSVAFGEIGFFGWASYRADSGKGKIYWYCYIKERSEIDRKELRNQGDEWFSQYVLNAHDGWKIPVEAFIRETTEFCVTNIYDLDTISDWNRSSAVVIGDAAHALNPIAGQGAATALEDAETLVRNLVRSKGDVPAALDDFELLRKSRVRRIREGARRSNKLLGERSIGGLRLIRNLAYKMLNTFVPNRVLNQDFYYSVKDEEEAMFGAGRK